MKAAAHNHSDVCGLLIMRGANIEVNEAVHCNTALHIACLHVGSEGVDTHKAHTKHTQSTHKAHTQSTHKAQLKHKAHTHTLPCSSCIMESVCLILFISKGNHEVIKVLLEKGAELCRTNAYFSLSLSSSLSLTHSLLTARTSTFCITLHAPAVCRRCVCSFTISSPHSTRAQSTS